MGLVGGRACWLVFGKWSISVVDKEAERRFARVRVYLGCGGCVGGCSWSQCAIVVERSPYLALLASISEEHSKRGRNRRRSRRRRRRATPTHAHGHTCSAHGDQYWRKRTTQRETNPRPTTATGRRGDWRRSDAPRRRRRPSWKPRPRRSCHRRWGAGRDPPPTRSWPYLDPKNVQPASATAHTAPLIALWRAACQGAINHHSVTITRTSFVRFSIGDSLFPLIERRSKWERERERERERETQGAGALFQLLVERILILPGPVCLCVYVWGSLALGRSNSPIHQQLHRTHTPTYHQMPTTNFDSNQPPSSLSFRYSLDLCSKLSPISWFSLRLHQYISTGRERKDERAKKNQGDLFEWGCLGRGGAQQPAQAARGCSDDYWFREVITTTSDECLQRRSLAMSLARVTSTNDGLDVKYGGSGGCCSCWLWDGSMDKKLRLTPIAISRCVVVFLLHRRG